MDRPDPTRRSEPGPDETVESAAERQAAPEEWVTRAKSIILFSDGTGNSSGKLFKTNVWRMYEAADLGPVTPGKRKQIAFYDNGVGTSALRPLALLAGIFGIGLKRNILEIYRFACRNYTPGPNQKPGADPGEEGDHIYGFGFSRGAFTMRLVVALIASQGLVDSSSEEELERRSEEAFRAFRRDVLPRKLKRPTQIVRAWRQRRADRRRRREGLPPYDRSQNWFPVIRFVGVWDTVAAYGGPITEITRAVDDWIYPLSMPDYQLDDRVRQARHALAIDDERDAFHPLLWDEVHEAKAIAEAREGKRPAWIDEGRLQQVWFTGMHADVGGGYPDESLSYVSFLWMMEEAEKAGLRVLAAISDRFRALANSAGPIHDSRSGPGAYYRYQPRNIAAWLDPPEPKRHLIQRDPIRVGADGAPVGFLRRVRIHESVAARIASGTDRYAPITLPARIEIVPPQKAGETALQADNVTPDAPPAEAQPRRPMIPDALRRRMEDPELGERRAAAMEPVWDRVWWRRVIYFAALAATLSLLLLPAVHQPDLVKDLCGDDRCLLQGLIEQAKLFVPAFAEPWVDGVKARPLLFLALIVLILFLLRRGRRMERRLRDRSAAIWQAVLARRDWPEARPAGRVRRMRQSLVYQRLFRGLKWYALPSLIAFAMAGFILFVLGAAATQAWLLAAERSGAFCGAPAAPGSGRDVAFDAASPCTDLGYDVRAGTRYSVTLRPTGEWRDLGFAANPVDGVADPPFYMDAMLPYKRVLKANWLEPLVEIRSDEAGTALERLDRRLFGPAIDIRELDFSPRRNGTFVARFTAQRSGRLHFMLNDAALPFLPRLFYRNNRGAARITVEPSTGLERRAPK